MYGTEWLRSHVQPVIGTFGHNWDYKELGCERSAQAVWGDTTGFIRALGANNVGMHKPSRLTRLSQSAADATRARAIEIAEDFWANTIAGGGEVYIKEGGQSDFTMAVTARLMARWPGIGTCIHVVQHSTYNEESSSNGVMAALQQSGINYLGPKKHGHGPITNGNGVLSSKYSDPDNAAFIAKAITSWMGCAWQVVFEEFRHEPSYCDWKHGSRPMTAEECIDFSDTHELAYILGVPDTNLATFKRLYLSSVEDAPLIERSIDCNRNTSEDFLQPLLAYFPPSPLAPPVPEEPPSPDPPPSLPPGFPPKLPPLSQVLTAGGAPSSPSARASLPHITPRHTLPPSPLPLPTLSSSYDHKVVSISPYVVDPLTLAILTLALVGCLLSASLIRWCRCTMQHFSKSAPSPSNFERVVRPEEDGMGPTDADRVNANIEPSSCAIVVCNDAALPMRMKRGVMRAKKNRFALVPMENEPEVDVELESATACSF
mmetsp:Transcript_16667/g.42822  ORF Transcript_16667/g.42822 Transcript_16667/m.42822 type:complete len:487 (-) Transcript_16667:173-1633(-)|eukprot:CAMPEP_0115832480 /NCGR_PEP_ID=MMETSP0287-20121206/2681_1 /TAXON_ID=412157 /ORGANISM="Chrysochromulina rotalis, Strain UIO044" /LENGTH=486 /DNA_ID=CAMNT_0003285869 /DNA_START=18 /DNA_END=1478 /DNA_ORIENTATION=+